VEVATEEVATEIRANFAVARLRSTGAFCIAGASTVPANIIPARRETCFQCEPRTRSATA